jgi:hypothetical protein
MADGVAGGDTVTDDERTLAQMPLVPSRCHPRLRPLCWLIAIAAAIAVCGLAVWTVQTTFTASSHESARKHIVCVALGLVNYSEFHGHLPYPVVRQEPGGHVTETGPPNGTGRPLHSWRVEIVPYLEGWHGTSDRSQPWDHPINKQLVELSSFYAYGATGLKGHAQSFPETNLLAITGPGTAFGNGKGPPMALKDVPPQTIIVVETRASGIPWPAPGDFDIRTMPQTINARDGKGISSRNAPGFHLIFADGQTWLLSDKVPFESLKKFFTTADAEKHDREELLGPFALHRGP